MAITKEIFSPVTVACLVLTSSCMTKPISVAIKNAGDEARKIARTKFSKFEIAGEFPIYMSEASSPITIQLKEAHCYRIIAIRASASYPSPVELNFKHSRQIVEKESDFWELSKNDGDLRKKRVIWGFCIWPALKGKLKIFTNLNESGGYLTVVVSPAKKLSWKDGRDIKLYLKGMGLINLEEAEKKELEPRFKKILSIDHMNVPKPLEGKAPVSHKIVHTDKPLWEFTFTAKPAHCYHLLLASVNCAMKYEIVNPKTGKKIYHDGAPEDVGRRGWRQDFCMEKKIEETTSVLKVQLKMITDEYEHYWFAFALYEYKARTADIVKTNLRALHERNKVKTKVNKCISKRNKCTRGCIKKRGKKKVEDPMCNHSCLKHYAQCTSKIEFEGELPASYYE